MKRIIIGGVLVLAALYLASIAIYFYRDQYPDWSDYILGIENRTTTLVRNGKMNIFPGGKNPFGTLAPGQLDKHMDPPWPLPEKFLLSFDDPDRKHHELEVPSGLKKGFKGRVTVVLKKRENGEYYAEVETGPLDR